MPKSLSQNASDHERASRRWFEVRAARAPAKYHRLKAKAEKYFSRIGGGA